MKTRWWFDAIVIDTNRHTEIFCGYMEDPRIGDIFSDINNGYIEDYEVEEIKKGILFLRFLKIDKDLSELYKKIENEFI
jgi:hypothetical protein